MKRKKKNKKNDTKVAPLSGAMFGKVAVTSAFPHKSSVFIHPHVVSARFAFSKVSTLGSVFKSLRFRYAYLSDTCGRKANPQRNVIAFSNLSGYVVWTGPEKTCDLFIFSYLSKTLPSSYDNLFTAGTQTHQYNTRQAYRISIVLIHVAPT